MKHALENGISVIIFLLLNGVSLLTVGFTIFSLRSENKYVMGLIILPSWILLNITIVKRIKILLKNNENFKSRDLKNDKSLKKRVKYVIELNNENKVILRISQEKYIFPLKSIAFLILGGPIISLLLFLFFTLKINYWLPELVAIQSKFLLKHFFNINAEALISSEYNDIWYLRIAQNNHRFYFDPMCTAIHVFSIYTGMIICIPKSQDQDTRKLLYWRKTKTLVSSISIIYIVNLIRISSIIYGAHLGFSWGFFHDIINYISGIFAAFIFIFLKLGVILIKYNINLR